MLWDSFKLGFTSAFRLFGTLAIDLPLLVFLTLPAYCVGYAWRFVRGGFLLGMMGSEERAAHVSEWRVNYKGAHQ